MEDIKRALGTLIGIRGHSYCYIHDYMVDNWGHFSSMSGMFGARFKVKFDEFRGAVYY